MPKVNPYLLPRPPRREETFAFTEGTVSFSISLRTPDFSDVMRANQITEELWATYVTGTEVRGAASLPDPDIKPSRGLFRFCALVAEMQFDPGEPGWEPYTALDLIMLSVRLPLSWQRLNDAVNRLLEEEGAAGDPEG